MDLNKILPQNIASLKGYIAGKTISEVREEYQPAAFVALEDQEFIRHTVQCVNQQKEEIINN